MKKILWIFALMIFACIECFVFNLKILGFILLFLTVAFMLTVLFKNKFNTLQKIVPIVSIVLVGVSVLPNFILILNKEKQFKYVLHAGGGLDGNIYLNATQCLEHYIEKSNGESLIELDFLFTSDGHIICSHTFEYVEGKSMENRPTLEEIKNVKLLGKYDVITFDYLIKNSKLTLMFK